MMSHFDGKQIKLEEIHRFPNEPVWMNGRFYWDFLRLLHELKEGLKKIAHLGVEVAGIGLDTWGVDYGLLDKDGQLLSNPVHYRDGRGDGMLEEIEKNISFQEIYQKTGIQYMSFNTLYQLYHDIKYRPHIVAQAESLLFMPDLFCFALTGKKYNEYTEASTSQMLNAFSKEWDMDLLERAELPAHLLQPLIHPGEVWGTLSKEIQEEVGLPAIPVIAVGSHDTASAVAGTPLTSSSSAYLSCGTWSLLGMELDDPMISELSYEHNFTNEGGVEGKIRFLKNITGLWIIQQLKRGWANTNPEIGYAQISQLAKEVTNTEFIIDPNDEVFVAPFDMAAAIQNYCKTHGQEVPKTIGEIARAAYNGIVDQYKEAVLALEEITGQSIDRLHMVGGGIQDQFLCQLTANAIGKTVVTGPIEASVLGNVMMQLKGLGYVQTLEEARQIIMNSFEMKEYKPQA
ncbi:MAG: rhamnulokinase [Epulopiscium sp.]|nr:rhamnulokinase [Candidatus Epulonipiscium sp.]